MNFVIWYSVVVLAEFLERAIPSSTRWPGGQYSLLKPKTGCPDKWKYKGWVFQDSKNTEQKNNRSEILHIDGYVGRNYVVRSFCIKAQDGNLTFNWPQGQYCIYGNGEAKLSGMKPGLIKIYGETDRNEDAVKYIANSFAEVKRGERTPYVKFYFACQTSGNKSNPIDLPITKPFYLLPYGSRECQQVKWMVATKEWIRYQTKNNNKKENQTNGTVPYHELGELSNKGIRMHYCYYQSCNYTLKETKGVFHSPGFPTKYPNGQLCSWRIMVPANHTVRIHFTNVSLFGKYYLSFVKIEENIDVDTLNQSGVVQSSGFTHTSESDIKYVFHSNQANSSSGFRAEYEIFLSHSETSKPSITKENKKAIEGKSNLNITMTTKTKTKPTEHQSSVSTNGRTANTIKKRLFIIVMPLVCSLFFLLLIVNVAYLYRQCRLRNAKSFDSRAVDRAVDRFKLNVNPTYERGDIMVDETNDTTTAATTTLDTTDNGTETNLLRTSRHPYYEDIECYKLNKTTVAKEPESPECNGHSSSHDVQDGSTNQKKQTDGTHITDNPAYESVLNSPPLVEANKLYDSLKVDQEKAKEVKASQEKTEASRMTSYV